MTRSDAIQCYCRQVEHWIDLPKKRRRELLSGLRRELVRLAGLTDESLDLKIFTKAADRMEEDELLELTRIYQRRMDEKYPPIPQLRPRAKAECAGEDGAFLI